MSEEMTIRVNFSRPIPIFPLDGVVLLPQQVMPLHIFEERYRQMVRESLDSVGQIAMAVVKPGHTLEYHGRPPLLPAVCVGQIEQHESLPDGRYNILLRGVCRAEIIEEEAPDGERLYRQAMLQPVGLDGEPDDETEELRGWLDEALQAGPLSKLAVASQVREFVENEEVPTPALLELVSFAVMSDQPLRYRLLAEGDVNERAKILRSGLDELSGLIRKALAQNPEDWPKGCSWN
jgi:Lon protease-like protein